MRDTKNILDVLNEKQREAVRHTGGPLLVLAGPGSGKTRTLIHRVAFLLQSGVRPKNILAVTFTNKAAGEIKERILDLAPRTMGATGINIGTFHSICARILRKEAVAVGRKPNFSIYDEGDQTDLLRDIAARNNLEAGNTLPYLVEEIARFKESGETEMAYAENLDAGKKHLFTRFLPLYEAALQEQNAFDFADLILKTWTIFQKDSGVLEKYRALFTHILVDEYQDTNRLQYLLIKALGEKHGNVWVVGDDSQSIYSWRGANFKNLFDFEKDWPGAKSLVLEQNYRSTQVILDAATALISHNTEKREKELWTANGKGSAIVVKEVRDEREEADFAAKCIERLAGGKETCAVLYRTNAQSRAFEEALVTRGILYQMIGSVAFYARREIKDVLAYLRLIRNPDDFTALRRAVCAPPRGVGEAALQDLARGKTRPKVRDFLRLIENMRQKSESFTPEELITEVLESTNYESWLLKARDGEDRLENVRELLTAARPFGTRGPEALQAFLEQAALMQSTDTTEGSPQRAVLMTMHAAKGLEFDNVFIVGCEEGILPHARSLESVRDVEEERRLCYVALTRARKNVFFSFARFRSAFGKRSVNPPSRFLFEIPENLVTLKTASEEADDEKTLDWDAI